MRRLGVDPVGDHDEVVAAKQRVDSLASQTFARKTGKGLASQTSVLTVVVCYFVINL